MGKDSVRLLIHRQITMVDDLRQMVAARVRLQQMERHDRQGRYATQAVEYLIVGLGGEIDRLCIHVEIGVLSVLSTAKISIPREKKEKYWKNRPQSIPVSVQIV